MLASRLSVVSCTQFRLNIEKTSKFVIFHFFTRVAEPMLVDVKKPCKLTGKAPDARSTCKTFVCVQRAIARMQEAFVDKVRVLRTCVPGGFHKCDLNMKFRLKTLTRLSNMQVNYAKQFKKRTITSYECFPIVSAWFAAHCCGLRSENHENSCDFPLVLSVT